jgi:hypothetical protein
MTWRDLLNDLYDAGNPKLAPAPVRDPPARLRQNRVYQGAAHFVHEQIEVTTAAERKSRLKAASLFKPQDR